MRRETSRRAILSLALDWSASQIGRGGARAPRRPRARAAPARSSRRDTSRTGGARPSRAARRCRSATAAAPRTRGSTPGPRRTACRSAGSARPARAAPPQRSQGSAPLSRDAVARPSSARPVAGLAAPQLRAELGVGRKRVRRSSRTRRPARPRPGGRSSRRSASPREPERRTRSVVGARRALATEASIESSSWSRSSSATISLARSISRSSRKRRAAVHLEHQPAEVADLLLAGLQDRAPLAPQRPRRGRPPERPRGASPGSSSGCRRMRFSREKRATRGASLATRWLGLGVRLDSLGRRSFRRTHGTRASEIGIASDASALGLALSASSSSTRQEPPRP